MTIGARGQPLAAVDLDRPGIDEPGMALAHVDSEAGIALDAVGRGDLGDDPVDPLDHLAEADLAARPGARP